MSSIQVAFSFLILNTVMKPLPATLAYWQNGFWTVFLGIAKDLVERLLRKGCGESEGAPSSLLLTHLFPPPLPTYTLMRTTLLLLVLCIDLPLLQLRKATLQLTTVSKSRL